MITRCEAILQQYLKTDNRQEAEKPKKSLGKGFDEVLAKEITALKENKK